MVEITQADREILAAEYATDPRYAGNAKVVRDGTHDDDTMYKHPLRAIAKLRAELEAARPLPREQQPGLEWRDFNSPGLKQQSLYFNGRSIGMVQKYGFDDQWQVHFHGDFSKHATEAEARQALWDAATAWLSSCATPLRDKTVCGSETAENERQVDGVHTQAGSSDSAAKRGSAGWQDIATAPKDGHFLTFAPDARESRQIQVAQFRDGKPFVVGGVFAFDHKPLTHWMTLPPSPLDTPRVAAEVASHPASEPQSIGD